MNKNRRPAKVTTKPQEAAEKISEEWEEVLEAFHLPCPLCKGNMEPQGVDLDRLYEFAEGEPGLVSPLDVTIISFVCNRCGYTAEFDSELFNPAYLARLSGAQPERVAHLTRRDFRVLVPLKGVEKNDTLLDLATATARSENGDILILNTAADESRREMLKEKIHDYTPPVGNPAPVTVLRQGRNDLAQTLPEIITKQRVDLLVIEDRGWGSLSGQDSVAPLIEVVMKESFCDIAVVHDHGLATVHRVLLATSGGPNARAAVPFVLDVVRAFDAELHLIYIASPDDPEGEAVGQTRIVETLAGFKVDDIKLHRHVITDDDPTQALIGESANYDLLLIGGSPRDWRGKIHLDSLSARVVRNSVSTAIVVLSRHDRPLSWLHWLLGTKMR